MHVLQEWHQKDSSAKEDVNEWHELQVRIQGSEISEGQLSSYSLEDYVSIEHRLA